MKSLQPVECICPARPETCISIVAAMNDGTDWPRSLPQSALKLAWTLRITIRISNRANETNHLILAPPYVHISCYLFVDSATFRFLFSGFPFFPPPGRENRSIGPKQEMVPMTVVGAYLP